MFEINLVTILAVIVNFLIIYIVFRLFFYKPVKNVIEKRDQSIKDEFNRNQSLLNEAEIKLKEAEEKFNEADIHSKKIIKDAEDIAEKMIQEKSIEAKKQAKEIILSAEEQSRTSTESANVYLKGIALKIASNLSLQVLSSILTPELDFELLKSSLNELENVNIYDESGKNIIGIKGLIHSGVSSKKGIIVKTAHEIPQNIKKEIDNKILNLAEEQVNINYEVDSSICGGFILNIGFNEIDLSISGQIKNLIEQLR